MTDTKFLENSQKITSLSFSSSDIWGSVSIFRILDLYAKSNIEHHCSLEVKPKIIKNNL